jgi:hypothetical protein
MGGNHFTLRQRYLKLTGEPHAPKQRIFLACLKFIGRGKLNKERGTRGKMNFRNRGGFIF